MLRNRAIFLAAAKREAKTTTTILSYITQLAAKEAAQEAVEKAAQEAAQEAADMRVAAEKAAQEAAKNAPWKKQRSVTRRYQRHQAAVKWAAEQKKKARAAALRAQNRDPKQKARDFNVKVAFRELTKTYVRCEPVKDKKSKVTKPGSTKQRRRQRQKDANQTAEEQAPWATS